MARLRKPLGKPLRDITHEDLTSIFAAPRYAPSDPEGQRRQRKKRARYIATSAIRWGILVRPKECEECGQVPHRRDRDPAQIHAHHTDYEFPLRITWLCRECHSKKHPPQPRVRYGPSQEERARHLLGPA